MLALLSPGIIVDMQVLQQWQIMLKLDGHSQLFSHRSSCYCGTSTGLLIMQACSDWQRKKEEEVGDETDDMESSTDDGCTSSNYTCQDAGGAGSKDGNL